MILNDLDKWDFKTNKIKLRKLGKYLRKYNNTFNIIDINYLIDTMIFWDKLDQQYFQSFFIKNMTMVDISLEFNVSTYKVRKSLTKSLIKVSMDQNIIRE